MPIYLVRWPDASCTVVKARDKEEAIVLLDEVGNAETAEISVLRNLMLDFELSDDGTNLVLGGMGLETQREVFSKAYPVLSNAQIPDESHPSYESKVKKPVKREKERVVPGVARLSRTPDGIELQTGLDMPGIVADRIVESLDKKVNRRRGKRDAN